MFYKSVKYVALSFSNLSTVPIAINNSQTFAINLSPKSLSYLALLVKEIFLALLSKFIYSSTTLVYMSIILPKVFCNSILTDLSAVTFRLSLLIHNMKFRVAL